ncbi:MAG: restriction endonuclease subunit S [Candidatus Woesearchaeota archaeon]
MIKQKLKKTEIGMIPKDWEVNKVIDLFEIETGTTPSTKDTSYWKGGTISWITPADITNLDNSIELPDSKRKITKKALEETNLKIMPLGSIVISTRAPVGYVGIVKKELTFNQGCKGLIPKDDKKINTKFYTYYFVSKKEYLNNISGGSTFKELSKDALAKLEVPMPPLPEQQAIANILSTVDNSIALVERETVVLERLKRGVMKELFGKKEWQRIKFEEICVKIKSGGTPLTSRKDYYKGNIPFVKIEDITKAGKYLNETQIKISENGLNNSTTWLVPKGSLLLAIYGSIGEIAINKIDVATNQAILGIVVNPNKADAEYVYYFFKNTKLARYAKQSTQANLTAEIIKSIEIPLPPLEEQKRIAQILSTLDNKLAIQQSKKSKLERVKKSLMNDLLTGKKRVQYE